MLITMHNFIIYTYTKFECTAYTACMYSTACVVLQPYASVCAVTYLHTCMFKFNPQITHDDAWCIHYMYNMCQRPLTIACKA